MIVARFFDGVSSRPRAVHLYVKGGLLNIVGADVVRTASPAQLRFALSHGSAPLRLYLTGGAMCEVPVTAAAKTLLTQLGARTGWAGWIETRRRAVLATLAAFGVLVLAIWQWGIPLAADFIVDRLPARWEKRLGDTAMQELDRGGTFGPSTLDPARQQTIRDAFGALRKPDPVPEFEIVFRRMPVPNAFALPGGKIVMGDELVALAQGDDTALMTVLGHELGHLRSRDGARALARSALFSSFAAWYLGDVSSLMAGATAGLTALHYSRAAESAADTYALDLMHANGVSTQGAAQLFGRLAAWSPPAAGRVAAQGRLELPGYLSTHPAIRERIERFAAAPAR